MRLILSRKGFDSSAGGLPSPVFPGGRFVTLPIPDAAAPLTYADIRSDFGALDDLLAQLSGREDWSTRGAHLDPDLLPEVTARRPGWQPSLGQMGTAQAHLSRKQVRPGDLFLFFALFREVEQIDGRWRFRADRRPFHALWGWLQVGEVLDAAAIAATEEPWVRAHPHAHGERGARNTLYIAREHLTLNALTDQPGAGVWPTLTDARQLTDPAGTQLTQWRLPAAFHPQLASGHWRTPLTYHQAEWRWEAPEGGTCRLKAAARGQEFVLSIDDYPDLRPWLRTLVS